jgi:protein-S-isoprenylcysteine O-methyltransferase Ste14
MKILSYGLALLGGLAIFAGLPLLGWGLGNLAGFFANLARVAYLVLIVVLQVFALIYNPRVGRYQEKRKAGIPEHKIDLYLIQVFSLAVVLLAPFSDRRALVVLGAGDFGRYLGLVFTILGFTLMQIAEKHLGSQFSVQVTLQSEHRLIQSGPYKWLRHPRYLGILMFFAGISLVFRSGLGLLVVAALLGVFIWRVLAEEALLRQEFGKDWEAYCAKSWRIIPFVF